VVGEGRWERAIHYEDGWVTAGLNSALDKWMSELGGDEKDENGRLPEGWKLQASPFYRILEYSEGGGMQKHSDGNNVHPANAGLRTQATMLVYLSTCADGGGATALFQRKRKGGGKKTAPPMTKAKKDEASCESNKNCVDADLIECIPPVRNTALIFPHVWPHTGCEVREGSMKIALRAELYLVPR
jgi:hypothetical protein